MKMIIVFLTCANEVEADKISNVLLEKNLIACVKKLPVSSKFWWEGKLDAADEVQIMLETIDVKFEEIQKEVSKLHSYDVPMLFSIEVLNTTEQVKSWLKKELNG